LLPQYVDVSLNIHTDTLDLIIGCIDCITGYAVSAMYDLAKGLLDQVGGVKNRNYMCNNEKMKVKDLLQK